MLMLAATNVGAGNLDLSEVKPQHLKDYKDVISGLLAEND